MKISCAFWSAILVTLAMGLIFGPAHVRAQNVSQASKSSEAPAGNAENGKRNLYQTQNACEIG